MVSDLINNDLTGLTQRLNPTLIWIWSLTLNTHSNPSARIGLNPTLIWIWSLTLVEYDVIK